ncbi:MAG TPA: hypothetical protein DDY98_02285, partial [Ruminococcaceae bacterium]|nr:hypothetical protein [Oscillospiraceae bacterium]
MKYSALNEPFAQAFLANKNDSISLRFAKAMVAEAPHFPVTFSEKSMLPSVSCKIPNTAFVHPWMGELNFDEKDFKRKIAENPSLRNELFEMKREMRPFITGDRLLNERSMEYVRFSDAIVGWGGRWVGHSNPDYGKLLRLGTKGIRKNIEENRDQNPGKDEFYDSCELALDAFEAVCEKVQNTCLKNAETETDKERKKEFLKMASVFERAPQEPCWDMYSAVICFWVEFSVLNADSPGSFDQYMFEFFEKSSEQESRLLIRRLLEGFHDHRSWNVCISGSDEFGNDLTNQLSYMILEEVIRTGYHTPNLTMRTHKNTPEKLWDLAIKSIGQGTGLPAIYNDEVVCNALEDIGIPPHDSHLYCMNGCNQIDILGKSHMGLEDGEVNLGKVLELTLHSGFNQLEDVPRKVMDSLGDPTECKTFDEFLQLYLRYQDYACDVMCRAANESCKLFVEILPNPIRSCLFDGCLEKGLDFKNGGPLYGHAQILLEGIADTADSLYAIKKLVYEQEKYTMCELIQALECNFENFDDLYHDCKTCEKFGNDISAVDELCATVVNHFNRYLKTIPCYRGGVFTGGCSTFNRAADQGIHTSALPNGKKKGEYTYAESITATPGMDTNGPTASLLSCLHYDQTQACSGFVTQMKFSKELFNSEKGKEAFKTLAKVYFARGGQQ